MSHSMRKSYVSGSSAIVSGWKASGNRAMNFKLGKTQNRDREATACAQVVVVLQICVTRKPATANCDAPVFVDSTGHEGRRQV